MLRTDHIEKALKSYPNFHGVYAVDKLPKSPRKGMYIANTEPSNKDGEHWVLFNILDSGTIEFFDTFGRQPKKRWTGEWVYSSQVVQSPLSTACGYHVLWFAYLRQMYSFRKILSFYSEDLQENDIAVKNFVKRVFDFQ